MADKRERGSSSPLAGPSGSSNRRADKRDKSDSSSSLEEVKAWSASRARGEKRARLQKPSLRETPSEPSSSSQSSSSEEENLHESGSHKKNARIKRGTFNELKDSVIKNTRIVSCKKSEVEGIMRDNFMIEKLHKVGTGLNGSVFVCRRVGQHEWLALKKYDGLKDYSGKIKDIGKNSNARDALVISLREVIVMKALKGHEYCAVYFEHFIIRNDIYIVMEMENGTLKSQIKGRFKNGMLEIKAKYWFFQMVKGLAFMHQIGIAHCDVHSGNVLIRKQSDQSTICKWTDFGLSLFLDHAKSAHRRMD